MESIFNVAPFLILGVGLSLVALMLNLQLLNAALILSPNIITALYPPLTGQILQAISVSGSVLSRIQFMVIFGGPFIIGLMGALNRHQISGVTRSRITIPGGILIGSVSFVSILNLISVLLLRPVNGQGVSVYIPIFAAILSLVSVWVFSSSLVSIVFVQRGIELVLLSIYIFLIADCFLHFAQWHVQSEVFATKQIDNFRFSPFESILNVQGRQSFFESDPENFGIFSVFAFVVLISSENRKIKIFGSIAVIILATTTQSRLFYLAAAILILLKISLSLFKPISALIKRAFIIFLFCVFYFLLVVRDNSSQFTGVGSFSGRTGIWDIVLKHWNDRGSLLGYQGTYSLKDYTSENSGRMIFFHTHNLILQFLWDWGFLGLALVLLFLGSLLIISTKVSDAGYFLIIAIILTGLIEPSFPSSVLLSKYVFVLVLVKHAASGMKVGASKQDALVPD